MILTMTHIHTSTPRQKPLQPPLPSTIITKLFTITEVRRVYEFHHKVRLTLIDEKSKYLDISYAYIEMATIRTMVDRLCGYRNTSITAILDRYELEVLGKSYLDYSYFEQAVSDRLNSSILECQTDTLSKVNEFLRKTNFKSGYLII